MWKMIEGLGLMCGVVGGVLLLGSDRELER